MTALNEQPASITRDDTVTGCGGTAAGCATGGGGGGGGAAAAAWPCGKNTWKLLPYWP